MGVKVAKDADILIDTQVTPPVGNDIHHDEFAPTAPVKAHNVQGGSELNSSRWNRGSHPPMGLNVG